MAALCPSAGSVSVKNVLFVAYPSLSITHIVVNQGNHPLKNLKDRSLVTYYSGNSERIHLIWRFEAMSFVHFFLMEWLLTLGFAVVGFARGAHEC